MVRSKSQEPLTSQRRLGESCAGIHLEPMETENGEDHSACKWDFCSRGMNGCIRTAPRSVGWMAVMIFVQVK